MASDVFSRRVADGMRERGVGLRALCREVGLDPSFFSKVLSGKRSPPAEESVLRAVASFLGLDAVELIVSAGRIPSEWRALVDDAALFESAHSLIMGGGGGRRRPAACPAPQKTPSPAGGERPAPPTTWPPGARPSSQGGRPPFPEELL